MRAPAFANLVVSTDGLCALRCTSVSNTAREHIHNLGDGVSVIGELMVCATREGDDISSDMAIRLGRLLQSLGDQIEALIRVYAESAAIVRKEIAP